MKVFDLDGLTYLWSKIKTRLDGKVDKVTGKGLSANDFTEAEKSKLAGIEAQANRYAHPAGTNPHGTTKADVGLGNVPNVATNDQTPGYTQASARANLSSGEKLSLSLGKLMKWYSDLQTVAWTGSYDDLTNKPEVPGSLPPSGAAGGDLSGSYPNPSVKDNSHAHTIGNVTGLQELLDGLETSASPSLKFIRQYADASVDADTLTDIGLYEFYGTANQDKWTNLPLQTPGTLHVYRTKNKIIQIFYPYQAASGAYYRSYHDNAFEAWHQIYTAAKPQTAVSGNAGTATKLAAARTIALSDGATGTATAFDGSGNISIAVTALDVSKANAGTLAVARGGTGATTAPAALTMLGAAAAAHTHNYLPAGGVTWNQMKGV